MDLSIGYIEKTVLTLTVSTVYIKRGIYPKSSGGNPLDKRKVQINNNSKMI